MIVEPGQFYLVELQLINAAHFRPGWLVGAFATSYPAVDVVSIEHYGDERATVRIRWRSPDPGEIIEGSQLSAVLEGIAMPAEALPTAVIESVEPTGEQAQTIETIIPDSLKLLMAGAMLGVTWYFAAKIKRKHEQSG